MPLVTEARAVLLCVTNIVDLFVMLQAGPDEVLPPLAERKTRRGSRGGRRKGGGRSGGGGSASRTARQETASQ